jgi:ACT domain-containing protein
MLGSLLEPEVLADILEALLQADETQNALVADMMSVLPRCERFETACMFLDPKEKQRESLSFLITVSLSHRNEPYIFRSHLDTRQGPHIREQNRGR